jgi:hypothetical protein
MSVIVKIVDGKYRVSEESTGKIAVNKNGVPLDGGGHSDIWKAIRQASHINIATEPANAWRKDLLKK